MLYQCPPLMLAVTSYRTLQLRENTKYGVLPERYRPAGLTCDLVERPCKAKIVAAEKRPMTLAGR